MPAEIARTTNVFRTQHEGAAPKRVYLSGAGANLPKIAEFFQEKLRLPVEFFNPLQKVSVGKGVDVEKVSVEAHQLGDIIGLGLRELDKTKLSIDLVPDVVEEQRADAKRRPKVIAAAAIAIASCAAYAVTGFSAKSAVVKEEKAAQTALKGVKQYSVPMDKQLKNATTGGAIVSLYGEAVQGRTTWLEVMNDLNAHFTTNEMWIVDFEPLVNFDPAAAEHSPYVAKEFLGGDYGRSALANLNLEPKLDSKGRANKNYVKPMINAVRVNGFRRSNNNQPVYDRTAHLIKESDFFTMEKAAPASKNSRKKETESFIISDIVVNNQTATEEGKIAAPFTIILPLTNPIPVE